LRPVDNISSLHDSPSLKRSPIRNAIKIWSVGLSLKEGGGERQKLRCLGYLRGLAAWRGLP
jgi:hypothetical protein